MTESEGGGIMGVGKVMAGCRYPSAVIAHVPRGGWDMCAGYSSRKEVFLMPSHPYLMGSTRRGFIE